MKRIVTILGSPKKSGNTASLLKTFERAASTNNEIIRINVSDYNIRGCLGCNACQKHLNVPGCIQKDDFDKTIHEIINSDLIIYSTPVYVWDFTSQMKALIDRHYCLVKFKNLNKPIYLLENRHTALLATCGGDIIDNTDLIREVYKREMNYLHCISMGIYLFTDSSKNSNIINQNNITINRMIEDLL